jgi:hypothetical protein
VLDFTESVALMMLAVLHLIPDEDKPPEIVATLSAASPPESPARHGHRPGDSYRPGEQSPARHGHRPGTVTGPATVTRPATARRRPGLAHGRGRRRT